MYVAERERERRRVGVFAARDTTTATARVWLMRARTTKVHRLQSTTDYATEIIYTSKRPCSALLSRGGPGLLKTLHGVAAKLHRSRSLSTVQCSNSDRYVCTLCGQTCGYSADARNSRLCIV